jgi:septal ring factor EnvC (AmiA/AmiB activator)
MPTKEELEQENADLRERVNAAERENADLRERAAAADAPAAGPVKPSFGISEGTARDLESLAAAVDRGDIKADSAKTRDPFTGDTLYVTGDGEYTRVRAGEKADGTPSDAAVDGDVEG